MTNTGKVAGAEVAQLYVSFPVSEVEQPPRHLKGFGKVYLEPGQTGTVEMSLVSGPEQRRELRVAREEGAVGGAVGG